MSGGHLDPPIAQMLCRVGQPQAACYGENRESKPLHVLKCPKDWSMTNGAVDASAVAPSIQKKVLSKDTCHRVVRPSSIAAVPVAQQWSSALHD
jgi:hypothetical protein